MNGRLRTRFLIIFCVTGLSIGLFLVLGIHLGLDLRGGVRLVLNVITDTAVRREADLADQPLNDAQVNIIRSQTVDQEISVIRKRLDGIGVGEVSIQRYGPPNKSQILTEIPGVTNIDRVKDLIKATAVLELRLVDGGAFENCDAARRFRGAVPQSLELLTDASGRCYATEKNAVAYGNDLKDAFRSHDGDGRPAVGFTFVTEAAHRFREMTKTNIGRLLAVILDDRIQSVAAIETEIGDSGIIRGGGAGFGAREVDDLVLVLKSGALPAPIKYADGGEQLIGPSLGADSIRRGIEASVLALISVIVFMLLYYRWAGLNAVVAMVLNLLILLGAMAYFRATLTLPGIAGIILTIGVGIDSSVLIFERIREELREGNAGASVVKHAFHRVFRTLMDTHLAGLISAAFLFAFGTGAVRGFAVTLVIGLVSNLFTSVFVSKTIFEWTLWRGRALWL